MMRHVGYIALIIAMGIVPANAWAASFTIDDWALSTGVIDTQNHFSSSFTPQPSPYINTQHVTVSPSEALSSFDFSWTPDTASFLIAASHVAFDGNGGTRSVSSGNIYITPTVDLLLTATGGYTYDLPGWDMRVGYGLIVYDAAFHEQFVRGFTDDTFIDGPTVANFSLDAQFIVPAGETRILSYLILIDALDSTGLLATGSGDIQFTLRPVPEPTTITMFCFGAMVLSRRRSRLYAA